MTDVFWATASLRAPAFPKRRSPRGRHERRGAGVGTGSAFQADGAVFWLTALVLAAALLFGGASRQHALQVMGLELLSLPLIPLALWRLQANGRLGGMKLALALLAAMAVLPLLQLAPIPFEVWRGLPGRADLADGLGLAHATSPWLPLSLTPAQTVAGLLALLIPAGIFLGASACTHEQRKQLAVLVILAAGLSLVLGLLQVAGGPSSPLRFYPNTNADSAVGLFANRNHQAIFLLLVLPLLGVRLDELLRARQGRLLVVAVACLGLFGAVLIGAAVTRSRAGLLLALPAILGALLLMWRRPEQRRLSPAAAVVALVCLAALTAIGLFAVDATLKRFAPGVGDDTRMAFWPYVAQAAGRFAPWGSGLGSFDQVYRSFEPVQLMTDAFFNHAHNEYLELWLELGWPGVGLTAAVLAWIAWRSVSAWRGPRTGPAALARAGAIMAGLLAVHSVVDYPLRTPAIMAVLALMCAALARDSARDDASVGHSSPGK